MPETKGYCVQVSSEPPLSGVFKKIRFIPAGANKLIDDFRSKVYHISLKDDILDAALH